MKCKYKFIRKSLIFIAFFVIISCFSSSFLFCSENDTLGLDVKISQKNTSAIYLATKDNISYYTYPASDIKMGQSFFFDITLENKSDKIARLQSIYYTVEIIDEKETNEYRKKSFEYKNEEDIIIKSKEKKTISIELNDISIYEASTFKIYRISLQIDRKCYNYYYTSSELEYCPIIPIHSKTLNLEVLPKEEWDTEYGKKEPTSIPEKISKTYEIIESDAIISGVILIIIGIIITAFLKFR